MIRRLALIVLLMLGPSRLAAAQDSGCFIIRLGQDTTSVECYRRTGDRIEVEHVDRTAGTRHRYLTYDLAGGTVRHLRFTSTSLVTGDTLQTVNETFGPDSSRAVIRDGNGPPREVHGSVPADAVVLTYNCPWTAYQTVFEKLVQQKSDSLRVPLHPIGSGGTGWLSLHRLGRDSVDLMNSPHLDHFHVRIDDRGRVLGALPISGTGKFTVNRVDAADPSAYAAEWAAREKAGQGLGVLSPRDTLTTKVAGATLWFDYGRPGKRGRVVYGTVVPFGEVWRTGANAATQFKTDRALEFGKTVVPAGFYTLWTVPGPKGWKLIVNSETGQWGTAHKDSLDLYKIDMKVGKLSQIAERFTIGVEPGKSGGTLNLDWDTTRASAAFTVKP
jgi:hypothetical protein